MKESVTTQNGDTAITAWSGICLNCHGGGVESFSTFADYRRFIEEEREREEDADLDEDDDYYYTPDRSGQRTCPTCKGTGEGDGHLIRCEYRPPQDFLSDFIVMRDAT